MNPMIERAQEAVEVPEVQDMIRRLSHYGLGVFVPHSHADDGEFQPLERDMVQVERGLQVSFVPADDPAIAEASPVGWEWDETKARVCASCYCCPPC